MRVRHSAREPRAFEAIQGRGDRARRETGQLRQQAGGHGPALLEDVDAPTVRAIDAEPRGGELVDHVVGPLIRPHLVGDAADQLLLRGHCILGDLSS